MDYLIREGTTADLPAIYNIIKRLAEFELPPRRAPEMFWSEDAALFAKWAAGAADHIFVHVAQSETGEIWGVAMASMGEEFFDHSPSAHLEVVSVASAADGRGVGKALIAQVEASAKKRGAGSLSLHVIRNNHRARHVYKKLGFEEEMIRCIKHFS